MDDRELLRRFRSGERRAFEELLTRHEAGLLRYATTVTGDDALAPDLVQEAFVALIQSVRGGRVPDRPSSWLYRVTRNRAADTRKMEARMRKRHKRVAVPEALPPATGRLEQEEKNGVLLERFARRPREIREVLHLKVQEGRSYRDIVEITGFSLGKVSHLVHDGLKQLSRELRAAGVV